MKITTDDIGINMTWNRKPSYPLRRMSIATRCVLLLLALANLLSLASGLAHGHLYLLSLAGVALALAAFLALRWSSARLCAITAERNRPRPDYALIARMEREVYGEAFHHDGAPDQETPRQRVERQAREQFRTQAPGAFETLHQMRRERKAREARGSVALDSGRLQRLARAERREHEDCEICHEMRSRYR